MWAKLCLIRPRVLFAFPTAVAACSLNFSRWSTCSPRSFSTSTFLSGALSMEKCASTFRLPRWKTVHFAGLNGSFHLWDQVTRASKSCWSFTRQCALPATTYTLVSSAKSLHALSMQSGRSFINTMNSTGPKTVPCGVPLPTAVQSEMLPFTMTRCFLSIRKEQSHSRRSPLTPMSWSFWRSRRWGTVEGVTKIQVGDVHRFAFLHLAGSFLECAEWPGWKAEWTWSLQRCSSFCESFSNTGWDLPSQVSPWQNTVSIPSAWHHTTGVRAFLFASSNTSENVSLRASSVYP